MVSECAQKEDDWMVVARRTFCTLVVGLAACSGIEGKGSSRGTPVPVAANGAPAFDASSVIREVRSGFHPDAGGWRAEHSTLELHYENGLEVRPLLPRVRTRGKPSEPLRVAFAGATRTNWNAPASLRDVVQPRNGGLSIHH